MGFSQENGDSFDWRYPKISQIIPKSRYVDAIATLAQIHIMKKYSHEERQRFLFQLP